MKMFEKIHDLVDDPKCLVFLLIDEVESLAQCRSSAEAGNEPTDSIRAVNALLTQIDRIKK
jgi:SpoVK/Ycf46/Vps4 family AAA+-type ATPase